MPEDLIFAIIMLIACTFMIIHMLYELFKIRDKRLATGAAFWITLFLMGVIICGVRITLWY